MIDDIGNIFGVLEISSGREKDAFFCGSHLDSQFNAGRFDGALGVAYACISALIIKERIDQEELSPDYNRFVVVNWTGEEGARFQPSLLGSRVYVGDMPSGEANSINDAEGISVKEALEHIGYSGTDHAPKAGQYLEIHIEQGRRLEDEGKSIGTISSCWGARKLRVEITGRADHTGPTPMQDRKDALLAASHIIVGVRAVSDQSNSQLHSSVGRLECEPNSPNTVADKATLWVEFRAAETQTLDAAEEALHSVIATAEKIADCSVTISDRETRDVVEFDRDSLSKIERAFDEADRDYLRLTTISGHDAVQLQSVCPSSLLFVPSHKGVTHSPDEFTSNDDICAALDASIEAMTALIAASGSSTHLGASHV